MVILHPIYYVSPKIYPKSFLSSETFFIVDNFLQVSFKLLKRIQQATRLLDQMLIQPRGQTKGQTTVQMVHID